MSAEKLSPSAEIKSVHELYELQNGLMIAVDEARWSPKQKADIKQKLKALNQLIKLVEKKGLHEKIMGDEKVLDFIRATRDVIELRLSGDKNWKTALKQHLEPSEGVHAQMAAGSLSH